MRLVFVSSEFNQKEHVLQHCAPDEAVLVVDVDRCIACGSCALACQAEHAAGFGRAEEVRRIVAAGGKRGLKIPRVANLPTSCRSCPEPCACNNGYSFWTLCPDEKSSAGAGRFLHCDDCEARLSAGLSPVCVTRCSMKCLYAGRAEDVRFALEEKRLRDMGEAEIC